MAGQDLERRSTSATWSNFPRHGAISSTNIEKRCFQKKWQTRWQTAIKTPNETRTRAANQDATTSFEPKNVSLKECPTQRHGRKSHTFLWGAFCANPRITARFYRRNEKQNDGTIWILPMITTKRVNYIKFKLCGIEDAVSEMRDSKFNMSMIKFKT